MKGNYITLGQLTAKITSHKIKELSWKKKIKTNILECFTLKSKEFYINVVNKLIENNKISTKCKI